MADKLWPDHPTLHNFEVVFGEKHYYLNHFWLQMWNSLLIAVTVGVLTLVVATGAAFAISRLKVRGGRTVMNLALFTYFIPAAFLAVPMYKTMGVYGLLNNQWALILAMVDDRRAVFDLGAEAGFRQAAIRTGRGCQDGRRVAAAALPSGLPAADDALAGRHRHLCAAAGVERVSLRVPAAVERHADHARRGARQLPRRRRFAVGAADDHGARSTRCRRRRSTTRSSGTWSVGSPPAP